MQVLRSTNRAQTIETARNESLTQDTPPSSVDGDAVDGFFNMDVVNDTPSSMPSNPFDALFAGAQPPPGTEAINGVPSADQFSPVNVVTLDQWLMNNPPEARFWIRLYIDKMQSIRDTRYQPHLDQLQQALANGGMQPQEVRAVQTYMGQLQETIAKMNQEIDKAQTKQAQISELSLRERSEMKDYDGDGRIRNEAGDAIYFFGKAPDGTNVILEKRGDKFVPAVNPYIDPQYKPALLSTNNVDLIPHDMHSELDLGAGSIHFDEAFSLNNIDATQAALTINHSIAEGIWVEADESGKPKLVNDPDTGFQRYNPKPFEEVTREGETDKHFWGQNPPTEEERSKWVFVKATTVKAEHEKVLLDGNEIDGSYVHFIYEDKDGNTLLRVRVQGVKQTSASGFSSALNTDGTIYVAASTAMVKFDNGVGDDGKPIKHSTRVSHLELDATGLTNSTGRSLMADMFDAASVNQFYQDLGLPNPQVDANGNFTNVDASSTREDGLQDGVTDPEYYDKKYRAEMAANSTLIGGFIDPTGGVHVPSPQGMDRILLHQIERDPLAERFGIDNPYDTEIENPDTELDTRTAYIPEALRDKVGGATGIFVKGLHGNILGPKDSQNIILVDGPNSDDLKEILPFKQDITPESPAYGNYVDAGKKKSIVISKGGDLYLRGGTFVWRDAKPGSSGDHIFMDLQEVNRMYEGKNNRLFVHIGDTRPDVVQIANGNDIDQDAINRGTGDEAEMIKDHPETIFAANDDWIEGDAISNAQFSDPANDFGGMDATIKPADEIAGAIDQQRKTILDDIIKYSMESDASLEQDAAYWKLPPMVDQTLDQGQFFNDFGAFFNDQQASTDFNLENMRNG